MLRVVGADLAAVGGDQLDGQQVVAGQSVLAFQPARAAAQGQPGDAGRGHPAAGRGEAVLPAPRRRTRPRCTRRRPWPAGLPGRCRCAFIGTDVDDQPVVVGGLPGHRVAARAHGHREAVAARPASRAARTSAGVSQAAISRGRLSIIALNSARRSSYSRLGDPLIPVLVHPPPSRAFLRAECVFLRAEVSLLRFQRASRSPVTVSTSRSRVYDASLAAPLMSASAWAIAWIARAMPAVGPAPRLVADGAQLPRRHADLAGQVGLAHAARARTCSGRGRARRRRTPR